MAAPPVSPLAILGTGLIGGSLGLALRRARFSGEIRGYDRPEVVARARRRGAVDVAARELESACRGAKIIVLALPVGAILDLLPGVAACAAPTTLITDVGSTKRRVMAAVAALPAGRARFVGGHPMAGREVGGIASARADLFADAAWLLVPPAGDSGTSRRRARPLLEIIARIGAHPVWTDAARHDAVMARLSHLPQLLATALGSNLAARCDDPTWAPLFAAAGPGARAILRLAASPYRLWRDILLTNSDEIEAALGEIQQEIEELRAALRGREMERRFAAAAALARRLGSGAGRRSAPDRSRR